MSKSTNTLPNRLAFDEKCHFYLRFSEDRFARRPHDPKMGEAMDELRHGPVVFVRSRLEFADGFCRWFLQAVSAGGFFGGFFPLGKGSP